MISSIRAATLAKYNTFISNNSCEHNAAKLWIVFYFIKQEPQKYVHDTDSHGCVLELWIILIPTRYFIFPFTLLYICSENAWIAWRPQIRPWKPMKKKNCIYASLLSKLNGNFHPNRETAARRKWRVKSFEGHKNPMGEKKTLQLRMIFRINASCRGKMLSEIVFTAVANDTRHTTFHFWKKYQIIIK